MSDFKNIIKYLRYNRRDEETRAKNKHFSAIVIKEDYDYNYLPHENDFVIIEKNKINNYDGYNTIPQLINFKATKLYLLTNTDNKIEYYVKRNTEGVAKFSKLPFAIWEEKDSSLFTEVKVIDTIYYDVKEERCIVVNKQEELALFPDTFIYHPDNISEANQEFSFNYLDEEGYTADLTDRFLRYLLSNNRNFNKSRKNRKVNFIKSQTAKRVNLFPEIGTNTDGSYYLKYNYYQKGVPSKSVLNELVPAIYLEFKYFGALLEYLNQTIFYYLDDVSDFESLSSKARQQFFWEYTFFVNKSLLRILDKNPLEVFYYVPVFMFKKIDTGFLWDVLEKVLKHYITNVGLNVEDIVIKLLNVLKENSKTPYIFLTNLLNRKTKSTPFLKALADAIDGENFKKYVSLIQSTWKESDYKETDPEKTKYVKITKDSPVLLEYRSGKTIGFHTDNASIDWNKKTNRIDIEVKIKTGIYEEKTIRRRGEKYTILKEKIETHKYSYHPFSPICILNSDNPQFIFKDQEQQDNPFTFMPAFVLYAREDSAFWQNFVTGLEYTVDVVTTFSGVGNLLKVGRLARILNAGHSLIGKTKKVTKIIKYVKGVAGVVEVTSGVANILIKLSGKSDTAFGRAITKYLFYLEMLSLGGELSAAFHGVIQKGAKDVLKHTDELNNLKQTAKNTDEAKQIDELVEHLTRTSGRVAEGAGSTKFITKGKHLDKTRKLGIISKLELELIDQVDEFGVFVDFKGKQLAHKFTDKNPKGVNIPTQVELITKRFKRIFIHNHPESSPLSAFDIMTFVKGNMQELRAVCKNGDVYAVIKKGELPSEGDAWKSLLRKVTKRVKEESSDLIRKADQGDIVAKYQYDEKIADILIEELGELIEYVKYE